MFPNLPGWLFNTKARDIGIPLVCGAWMGIFVDSTVWANILAFGLLFWMLTTYWDWLFDGWDNFWFHGFTCGLAYLPYVIVTGMWWQFGVRCLLMTVVMGAVSHVLTKNDWVEELTRGFIIAVSMILFLV